MCMYIADNFRSILIETETGEKLLRNTFVLNVTNILSAAFESRDLKRTDGWTDLLH
jgi:hypothetical protein